MPIFLDIEASGLHFDAYPIELALLLDGQIHSWLIKPEPQWTYWSEQAQAMHGITQTMLAQQGLPAKQVALQLNELLADGDGVVYSDACAWDEDWLNILFHACGEIRMFHLLQVDELFIDEAQARFYLYLRQLQACDGVLRHRAAQDVAILNQAYLLTMAG